MTHSSIHLLSNVDCFLIPFSQAKKALEDEKTKLIGSIGQLVTKMNKSRDLITLLKTKRNAAKNKNEVKPKKQIITNKSKCEIIKRNRNKQDSKTNTRCR